MIISWKTDGSAGAVDTMQDRLANGTNSAYPARLKDLRAIALAI